MTGGGNVTDGDTDMVVTIMLLVTPVRGVPLLMGGEWRSLDACADGG